MSDKAPGIGTSLECLGCHKTYAIVDDIPQLVQPDELAAQLSALGPVDEPYAKTYDRANRNWLLRRGLVSILWERRVRRALIERLGLHPGATLLETAVGTGTNLLIAAESTRGVVMHGTDLSSGMLRVARTKALAAGVPVTLTQANAEYLPYREGVFDAVLHVGAINQFGDKARAIAEMHRVAKPGARIVMCDEGLHPDKARTMHGRWILRHDVFRAEPPLALLPARVSGVQVSWVLQRAFWVVEFAKTA
jgi:ubiquinone/menaquinone biosynthesis C-methylase UbiE